MKKEILKLAGVKSESAFYKKFPTEEAFMKVHGKAFKKAAMGASMVNKQLHQLTDFDNPPQAQFGRVQSPYSTSISGFGKNNTSLDASSPRALGDLTGPTDFGMRNATDTSKMFGNFQSGQAIGKGLDSGAGKIAGKGGGGAAGYLQAGMDVVEGISMIKGQNKAVKEAKQNSLLTGVQAQAVASKPRDITKNYYTRPEDTIIQPDQLFPSYGVGTNILSAQDGAMIGGNPGEIQNTYAPNTLYDDLGYEPLNDSDQVKAFYHGGRIPMAASGFSTALNQGGFGDFMSNQGGSDALGNISNMLINKGRGPSAGSKIGGGIGAAAGTYFGGPVGAAVGKFAGQAIGSLIDSSGRNIEKYNNQSDSNVTGMMGSYIPQQFGNVMEDGGWISNDWTPQTITQFGEYSMKDLLKPPHDADMLRAGGHLRSYTPPSEKAMQSYAMGGELQVYRGKAEPISTNPYLPDGGETIMFRGPSHENGGMPISYGQSPVEVEGGEPAVKLRDGGTGEDNMVVFGNLKIDKQGAEMLGNPKLKNKKFKNYVNDLSKIEAKQNKIIDRSTEELDLLTPINSFDKLKLSALESNLLGGNMKLKDIASKKQDAAALQSAINDTAEEYGVVADDLAQGKIKMDKSKTAVAKYGKNIPKAQAGTEINRDNFVQIFHDLMGITPDTPGYGTSLGPKSAKAYDNWLRANAPEDAFTKEELEEKGVDGNYVYDIRDILFGKKTSPEKTAKMFMDYFYEYPKGKVKALLKQHMQSTQDDIKKLGVPSVNNLSQNTLRRIIEDQDYINNASPYLPGALNLEEFTVTATPTKKPLEDLKEITDQNSSKAKKDKKKFPWEDISKEVIPTVNKILPFFRPSDQEELDPRQLSGEMYALSNNQLEPVQAQTYQPQLQTPYDISLQDQLNEITAQTRQAERLAQNNPAALAAIYAQAEMAKNKVLGEQMRINQAQKAQVYGSNINTLNEAQLMNLKAYDAQQGKQETAKSLTKATTQAALNSIASKYAQNKLSNRNLIVGQQLSNYRFDKSGRAINMNPLVDFDEMIANATPDELSKYKALLEAKSSKKESTKESTKASRNGSIVRSIKNL
jgi:hypothetical protein